jgi:hypothetical protein
MGDPSSERAKLAGDVFAHLQRTVRFFRLYPHDHRFCTLGLADTYKALSAFHGAHGPLAAEVGNDGLYMDEELVLADGGNPGDLVPLLYFEAIREVTLDAGMPKEELQTLVKILAAPYPESGKDAFADDLTTALWREDLHYLDYQTHDALAASTVRGGKQEGVVGALMQRIRGIVEFLGGSLEAGPEQPPADEPEALDGDTFLGRVLEQEEKKELDDKADWATHPDRALQYLETEKGRERKRLVDELSRAGPDDDLSRAAEVVAWSIGARHPGVRDEDAARFIAGSTLHALGNGELEQATRMADLASRATSHGSADLGAMVSARLSSADGIQALARTLSRSSTRLPGKKLNEVGLGYLTRLGEGAVQGACESYAQVDDARVRRVLRDFLATHVERSADAIGRLMLHRDATIAGEAAELLGSRGRDSAGFSVLQQLANQNVRAAADKVLELTGEADRARQVRVVLGGEARAARLAALAALARAPGARTFDDLVGLFEGDGFHGRDADELGALLDLLLACDARRARSALVRLQALKVPLLRGRGETQRLKECAEDRLRRLGGGA